MELMGGPAGADRGAAPAARPDVVQQQQQQGQTSRARASGPGEGQQRGRVGQQPELCEGQQPGEGPAARARARCPARGRCRAGRSSDMAADPGGAWRQALGEMMAQMSEMTGDIPRPFRRGGAVDAPVQAGARPGPARPGDRPGDRGRGSGSSRACRGFHGPDAGADGQQGRARAPARPCRAAPRAATRWAARCGRAAGTNTEDVAISEASEMQRSRPDFLDELRRRLGRPRPAGTGARLHRRRLLRAGF